MMAVSSTTATLHISHRQNFASGPRICPAFSHSITLPATTKPLKFATRSTGGDAPGETTATATQTEAESETPTEVSKGPPSLISALNVERALLGIPITDVDYYGSLGIQKGCSNDQVYAAYKNKVDQLMNEGLDEEELSKKVEVLKEAFSVLSSPEERRLYDWSLARTKNPDQYLWPFEVDDTKKSPEEPQKEPEDIVPTRLVGYFFLGWLVLSFSLSIYFNL